MLNCGVRNLATHRTFARDNRNLVGKGLVGYELETWAIWVGVVYCNSDSPRTVKNVCAEITDDRRDDNDVHICNDDFGMCMCCSLRARD